MRYHILFSSDNQSVRFQGEDGEGIVDPYDILKNGKIVKNIVRNDLDFMSFSSVDIVFIPDEA